MISIIIPVYNGEKTLIETVKSIERQTYRNFEVIIINDGSTDRTLEIFESFSSKVRLENNYYFMNQGNKGAPFARNRGFKMSRGDYLFFCDADSVLEPGALEKMLETLEANPTASYCYSSFLWGRKLFKLWPFNPEKLRKMPYIHTMSLIRREHFPETGWDEDVKRLQDWDLWLTMLENGYHGVFLDEVLFRLKPVGTISSWLPAFAYRYFKFLPAVKSYNRALKIIKNKHNLV